MAYFSDMEKPGWGAVVVIVLGIAGLAFFLVFADSDRTGLSGTDQAGTPVFTDKQTKDMARDTMKVVDGTESKEEIVRGSADVPPPIQYDPAGGLVSGVNETNPNSGLSGNELAVYLQSVASASEAATTSLFASINRGDFAAVQSSLDRGEDVHSKDPSGNSVLHQAATQGVVELGAFLIRYGADVNAVNGDGQTPLDFARSASKPEFEQLLLAYGARSGTVPDVSTVSTPE